MTGLDGAVIVVTGASGGIGRAVSSWLGMRGSVVFDLDRRPLARQSRADRFLQTDVGDPDSVDAAVAAVLSEAGRIDGLVAAAGLGGTDTGRGHGPRGVGPDHRGEPARDVPDLSAGRAGDARPACWSHRHDRLDVRGAHRQRPTAAGKANSDPVTQINQVNTMVSQGADLIVVNAVSPQAEKAQLSEAAKKIPLMFIDTAIPDVGFTAVQSDNAAIGSDAGQLMAKRVGSGKTLKLAILNGGPTDAIVGPVRQQGFLDGLKKGRVTVDVVASAPGEYSKDKAVPAMENMLSAHSDIQAVLGLNDAMALGALDVLDRAGKKDVLVSGIDGQKEALAEIKKGGCNGQYVSTGLNSPKLATDKVMEIAAEVTTGQKQPSSYPATSFTTAVGIGCENVNTYYDASSIF